MYIPEAFHVDDMRKIASFIGQNSFATLISQIDGIPFATHLPLLFDADDGPYGRLVGHMARANHQWRHFAQERETLSIFHGPHAYISPRWYQAKIAVPTWNYAVVHAYGIPQLINDPAEFSAVIERTVSRYEGETSEKRTHLPAETQASLMKAIVGFYIPLTRIECKFKLGQNRSKEDVAGVYQALSQSTDPQSHSLANLMKSEGMIP